MQSLTPEQQQKALAQAGREDGELGAAQAFRDNLPLPYAGIPASELEREARGLLTDTIAEYVNNLPEGQARGPDGGGEGASRARRASAGSADPGPTVSSTTGSTARSS